MAREENKKVQVLTVRSRLGTIYKYYSVRSKYGVYLSKYYMHDNIADYRLQIADCRLSLPFSVGRS